MVSRHRGARSLAALTATMALISIGACSAQDAGPASSAANLDPLTSASPPAYNPKAPASLTPDRYNYPGRVVMAYRYSSEYTRIFIELADGSTKELIATLAEYLACRGSGWQPWPGCTRA